MTLVQLFAWLTETMLYEMNRVPERNYIKFLQLLGLELEQAVPAVAYLKFTADPGARLPPGASGLSVPERTPVAAQSAGGDPTVFETRVGLSLIRVPLTDVQVLDGAGFTVVTTANNTPGTPYRPLGWVPQVGNALYLGFDLVSILLRRLGIPAGNEFPGYRRAHSTREPGIPAGNEFPCVPAARSASLPPGKLPGGPPAPAPPATLSWEYRAAAGLWRRLEVDQDESAGFTREGTILVRGPADIPSTVEGRVKDPRFWLRASAWPPAPTPPGTRRRSTSSAPTWSLRKTSLPCAMNSSAPATVHRAGLRAALSPVRTQTIVITIPDETGQTEEWERRDDFLGSNADNPHYEWTRRAARSSSATAPMAASRRQAPRSP